VAVAVTPELYTAPFSQPDSQTLGRKTRQDSWNLITQTVTPEQYFTGAFLPMKKKKGQVYNSHVVDNSGELHSSQLKLNTVN
jgi:hypothetical protein